MSPRRRKGYDRSVYQSFVMITQFGINMLVPVCLMSVLGIYLDEKLGTSYWMVILFFIGAIAGGRNIYRLAKQIYTSPGNDSMSGQIENLESTGEEMKHED